MTIEKILKSNPYIIAEVGSNHQSLDDCIESIHVAKSCGADAVKFQYFTHRSLYGYHHEASTAETRRKHDNSIDPDWIPRLSEKAKAFGIDFSVTAFSLEHLKEITPYIDFIKIASSDCHDKDMITYANESDRYLVVSVGGRNAEDISQSIRLVDKGKTTVLYCVSEYPAKGFNPLTFEQLQRHHPSVLWGYSDHSIDWACTPQVAVKCGAKVLEKHFKLRDFSSPDNPHSLLPEEFKQMVSLIREPRATDPMTKAQMPMRMKHNKRAIAITHISNGDTLESYINYGPHRSLKDDDKGISPLAFVWLDGKVAERDIEIGETIGWADVSQS